MHLLRSYGDWRDEHEKESQLTGQQVGVRDSGIRLRRQRFLPKFISCQHLIPFCQMILVFLSLSCFSSFSSRHLVCDPKKRMGSRTSPGLIRSQGCRYGRIRTRFAPSRRAAHTTTLPALRRNWKTRSEIVGGSNRRSTKLEWPIKSRTFLGEIETS